MDKLTTTNVQDALLANWIDDVDNVHTAFLEATRALTSTDNV